MKNQLASQGRQQGLRLSRNCIKEYRMKRPKPQISKEEKSIKSLLYYGDNLEVLRRKIKNKKIDLCYINPPFNSNVNITIFIIMLALKIERKLRLLLIPGNG